MASNTRLWSVAALLTLCCFVICTSNPSTHSSLIVADEDDAVIGPVVGAIQPNHLDGNDDQDTSSRNRNNDNKRNRGNKKKNKKKAKKEKEAAVIVADEVETIVSIDDGNSTLGNETEEEVVARIPYTRAPVNNSYVAEDSFAAKGMEHLYFITDLFLNIIHRDEEIPTELGTIVSEELQELTLDEEQGKRVLGKLGDEWDVLVVHYIGVLGLVVLGLLLAAVMPLVGLVLMCCRCAGRCGASELSYDKKHDPCKRGTLTAFMIVLLVLALLGVVCAFVSNSRMEEGVQTLPTDLREAVHDTQLFLNNTDLEVHAVFVTNYGELQDVLFHKLDSSGELVKKELARVTQAVAIDNLTSIATSLSNIKQDLTLLKNTTQQLQEVTQYLRNGLESVTERLKSYYETCLEQPECQQIQREFIGSLHINTDFSQLPKVEHKLEEVDALLNGDIEAEVKRGKRAFDSIATEIQNKVQLSIPEIKDKIRQAGAQLSQAAAQVREKLADYDINKRADPPISRLSGLTNEYSKYRYYAFLTVCFILLAILVSFVLAVLYGCCGRRADEASSCLKVTGATWMMTGVFLFFVFSSVVLVVVSALFVVGSLSRMLVCDPLSNPASSEVFDTLVTRFNLNELYPQDEAPSVMDIIDRCHRNESIYSVLKFHLLDDSLSSLLKYRDRLHLDEKVAQLKQEITVDTNVKILSRDAKQQLKALANSSLARRDDWANYAEILEQQVLTINLMDMAAQLNRTADQLPAGFEDVAIRLKNDALFLESLQRWLKAIRGHTKTLKDTTERLSGYLHYSNHTTLRPAIRRLINQAEFAQRYLRTNGSMEVVLLVERFSDDFLADVDDYVAHVEDSVQRKIGRCGPLSHAYNATTAALCKDVLYPFNGFWCSVGWVFMIFLPCVVLAVHLTGLYRKTEPWPGPLNESAYDKKPQRSREFEGGSSTSIGAPAQNHHHAYAGAPPNSSMGFNGPRHDHPPIDSGPPRYTSQPSLSPEYERPPPYYYPGPGN